jgi:hypothetical protein
MRGIFRQAENLLPFKEGLCSMGLVRTSRIVFLINILRVIIMKKNESEEACCAYGEKRMHTGIWCGNLMEGKYIQA